MENEIQYPARTSEFEIQAELFQDLKQLGYDIHGEVPTSWNRRTGTKGARFDLVIFRNKRAAVLIEVKSHLAGRSHKPTTQTKQYQRYSQYGLPVIYCTNLTQIEETIAKVECIFAIMV